MRVPVTPVSREERTVQKSLSLLAAQIRLQSSFLVVALRFPLYRVPSRFGSKMRKTP